MTLCEALANSSRVVWENEKQINEFFEKTVTYLQSKDHEEKVSYDFGLL
jgi:hypothetical protein